MTGAGPSSPGSARTAVSARGGSVVLRVRGDLDGEGLRRDLLAALAGDPPGVVCDLTSAGEPLPATAVAALLAVGAQAQLWPGAPVAVVCPDARDRSALSGSPLVVAESLHPALVAVRAHAGPEVARVQLPPHPVAARAARDFLARTCGGWELPQVVDAGCLAVSELVTAAMATATSTIGVSVRRAGDDVVLAVRGGSAPPPDEERDAASAADVPDAGNAGDAGPPGVPGPVVEALSRAAGVLVAADGEAVAWAVLAG